MSAEPLIRLEAVSKVFPGVDVDTHALVDVHFSVVTGEYVCIEGPSGCGKTTLMSLIGLLDEPTGGSYRLDGVEVARLGANRRAELRRGKIGFIFQSFNLIGDLTVAENIALPLTYRGWSEQRCRKRVHEVLERVSLAHRAKHMPAQLSGGQQQRVAVARAIAGEPKVLLADEPTGNLDSGNGQAVMEILEDLHSRGATICMVTHNPEFASFAERRVSLFDGRIVEERGREAA